MSEDDREIEFPGGSHGHPGGVIVVMGLPCNYDTEVAGVIGRWAGCPILLIDNFLDPISHEAGYGVNSLPSPAEAERLHRLAFNTLCSVARCYVDARYSGCKGIVIKSHICSTYELQRLLDLTCFEGSYNSSLLFVRCPLVFVECQFRNKYRWEENLSRSVRKWYGPRNWNDIDKAKDDYDPQAWDHHLHQLITGSSRNYYKTPRVKRLVVDPDYDLNYELQNSPVVPRINPTLANAIKFLLTAGEEEVAQIPRGVEFGQLRRYLMEKKIEGALESRERRECVCVGGSCVFKYWDSLVEQDPASGSRGGCCCGVCEEPIVSGEGGYSCYFCVLTMHKSCAEMPNFNPPPFPGFDEESVLEYQTWYTSRPQQRKCKSCITWSNGCPSCHFETHLKSRFMPTIITNPDFHEHMVSLHTTDSSYLSCKACGVSREFWSGLMRSRYGCNICETYYHADCVFCPRELDHKHGGHEHLMKLMFSHDGAEEEGYWCDICYRDIDPQVWFYSCRSCPCYVAHLHCAQGVTMFVAMGLLQYIKGLFITKKKRFLISSSTP